MLKKKKEVPIITSLRMLPSLKAELKKALMPTSGRRNAGRLEIQARQEPPEGQGRALDEEA